MSPPKILSAAGLLLSLNIVTAQAALIDRGNGLIYDTDLNVTWLQDANYAQTSGYDADGLMDWTASTAWAADLSYQGYTDWRLPTTLQLDPSCGTQTGLASYGLNCTGSELGHLFYSELGGTALQSILTSHNNNFNLFSNIQNSVYWSSTEYIYTPNSAFYFWVDSGFQTISPKEQGTVVYAWAVRSGDVATSSVPEPSSLALLALGMVALMRVRR